MSPDGAVTWTSWFRGWLAIVVLCAVVALAWYGYRAATEWQDSSALLVERRGRDLASLLATALTRDMRGSQVSVLGGPEWNAQSLEPPYEVDDVVATAFARYPYPECFFAWHAARARAVVFFTRADRPPRWEDGSTGRGNYPVTFASNHALDRLLRARIELDASNSRQYSAFNIVFEQTSYQVIARLVYREETREHLEAVLGFMTDLNWAREHYFSAIAQQASRIGEASGGLEYVIADEHGTHVVGPPRLTRPESAITRRFPAIFLDPTLIALDPPPDLAQPIWTISVSAARDPTLELAARGARRTLIAMAAAALLAGIGLLVSVRAAHESARVAAMRSDFVSAVTHELKTPLSTIRAIAETLVRGRLSTSDQVHSYAELLAQEERRLARLIDNLLAWARVTDVAEVYSFEPLSPPELVAEALGRFKRQLMDGAFEFRLDVGQVLPPVRADRTALVLALDNLIDNAIRYSGSSRTAALTAGLVGKFVQFEVADHGVGIPGEDLDRVQKRFVRGRSTTSQGSGLGLAIVRRIADDHRGWLRIESQVGVGTTVTLAIPVAEG